MISLWRCSVPSSSAVSPAPPGCAAALSPASSSQPPSELAGRPPPSEKHTANHILAILQFTVCKHELPENIQESNRRPAPFASLTLSWPVLPTSCRSALISSLITLYNYCNNKSGFNHCTCNRTGKR